MSGSMVICQMNKKGLLLYWISFIVIGAIGIVLVSTHVFDQEYSNIGKWHVNFLQETFQKAEIDLLENDLMARNAGFEVILFLAKSGGFREESKCGKKFWNKGDEWCIPVVRDVASSWIAEKTKLTDVKFTALMMVGRGSKKMIEVAGEYVQRYTYNTDVVVNLGYSFNEYAVLEQDARSLVKQCAGKSDDCVTVNMPERWRRCGEFFCVDSQYHIKGVPVVYEFGLDFS